MYMFINSCDLCFVWLWLYVNVVEIESLVYTFSVAFCLLNIMMIMLPSIIVVSFDWPSPVVLLVKNPPANAGDIRDMDSISGLGRSSGGGHGNQLQYSCLENPMDRGSWWAIVHRLQGVRHNWSDIAHTVLTVWYSSISVCENVFICFSIW